MKTFKIDIHPELKDVEITVKNGAKFLRDITSGDYATHYFETNEYDADRIKKFAVKFGDDNNSCRGDWYAHCNGYAMDLMVTNAGKKMCINTYRPYGRAKK